jgi:hypothetical protein
MKYIYYLINFRGDTGLKETFDNVCDDDEAVVLYSSSALVIIPFRMLIAKSRILL